MNFIQINKRDRSVNKLLGTMVLATTAAAVLSACGGGSQETSTSQPQDAAHTPAAASKAQAQWVQGWYAFDGHNLEEITFEDRDGWAYFQGDVILGTTEQVAAHPDEQRRRALGVYRSNASRWQNGVVFYDATKAPASQLGALRSAMWHISRNTPVRFSRDPKYSSSRTVGTETVYDVVSVQPETDPNYAGSSSVGRAGGVQVLRLNAGNPFDTAAASATHELLHALGAWHEHTRADRDSYVAVNTANIRPGYESQFAKHTSDGAMHGTYDHCSLMHYGREELSKSGGLETMFPLKAVSCGILPANGTPGPQPVTDIGQRIGLSLGDKSMIGYLYASAPADRPQAHAGFDQTLKTGCNGNVTLTLDGFGEAVSGSSVRSYKWTARSGASGPIANSASAKAQVSVPKPACGGTPDGGTVTYQFELAVQDLSGRSMSDVVTFTLTR